MGINVTLGGTGQDLGGAGAGDAAKVVQVDADGNLISIGDADPVTLSTGGLALVGKDYKLARALRASADGALQVADETLFLYDTVEGAAVDTNKWIQTTTTMTITQTTGVITFNANSTTSTTTGAMHTSHRMFPYIGRTPIVSRMRARYSATATNTVIELGFGTPASATAAAIGNGACWRKNGTGQWVPVLSINGNETVGTPISDAAFRALVGVSDYAVFWIMIEFTRVTFQIWTQTGALVNRQVIEWGTGVAASGFSVTHLQAFQRIYNSGVAGAAVQLFLSGIDIYAIDAAPNKSWDTQMVGMGYGSLTSPTAYTQLANYANSAAPASATLSNTAAGYTTLGGQFQWAAVAGAETDYALFGFQNPTPYQLYIRRVKISTFNTGAAAAATPTLLQWGLGFNASAVSLATGSPYPPMRKVIGSQGLVASAAIGVAFTPDVEWNGLEVVQPGRFFHVILKSLVSAATASEIIRGMCVVDGYFE